MKLGELIERTARVTGNKPDHVKRTARALREGGLMTTGARGVNAPDMTPEDAARLLIAYLAEQAPGIHSAELVRFYGDMKAYDMDPQGPFSIEALRGSKPRTLTEAIAGLIEVYAFDHESAAFSDAGDHYPGGGFNPPKCTVDISSEPQASAGVAMGYHGDLDRGARYGFRAPALPVVKSKEPNPLFPSLIQRRAEIGQDAIQHIAEGFRQAGEGRT